MADRPKTALSVHDEEATTWKQAFWNFTQRTTFHGWRYVTETNPFIVRRVVWFLICAAGFAGFTFQIVDRVMFYYSYPVTINVGVGYNKTLRFPAVTLCNLNSFRISKANSLGHYQLINELFDPGLSASQKLAAANNLNAGKTSLYDLYKEHAHLKSNIIVSCTWNGNPCSAATDFVETITDHGLCYTFNSNSRNQLIVSEPGSEHGLNLVINIEQYEYMRGPNSGAGLKLLVHDPDEFPLVRDLGQAVSPGTHAFMGLQVEQQSSLPSPFGNCTRSKTLEYFDYYTLTACRIDCETRWAVEKCNCKDLYMPQKSLNNPPTCDIETYLSCYIPAMEEFERVGTESCDCPAPCDKTLYAPNLSYGTTSSFDTSLFLRKVENKNLLQQNFITAREATHRKLPEFVQSDTALINQFTSSVNGVKNVIMTQLPDVVGRIDRDLMAISNTTQDIYSLQKHALTRMAWTFENYFFSGVDLRYSETIAQVAPGYSTMFETFATRLNEILTFNDTSYRKVFHGIITQDMLARKVLAEKADVALKVIYDAYKNIQPLKTNVVSSESYNADAAAFPTYYINEDFAALTAKHQITLTDLSNFKSSVEKLMAIGDETYTQRTLNSSYNDAKFGYIENAKTFIIDIDKLKSDHYGRPGPIIAQLMLDLDAAKEEVFSQIRDLQTTINTLKADLNRIQTETWPFVSNVANLTASYLTDLAVKKTSVAEQVTSILLEDKMAALTSFISSLNTRSQTFNENWNKLGYNYKAFWETVLGVTAVRPYHIFVGNTAITSTNSVAKNVEITNQFAVSHDITGGNSDETLKTALAALKSSYAQFLEENKIDATFVKDNFLEVDIFQEAMNVQTITQQQGYQGLACLCDIGGTMGLFAGASLITFCELLDTFFYYGIRSMASMGKVAEANGVQKINIQPVFSTSDHVKVWG